MAHVISVSNLTKVYAGAKAPALNNLNLQIPQGEIFALLGQNGAGKSTLINILSGITKPTAGSIQVNGHDVLTDYRSARSAIGLMPQELLADWHKTVWRSVTFSRGLYGKPPNSEYLERVLRDLFLWEQKDSQLMTLSGGMKRRLMIAKALAHEPRILILDEPTAGVDSALRRKLWEIVKALRQTGVTVILTTHYLEEAQEMADRVGVIRNGTIILVKEKQALMQELGKRTLVLKLCKQLTRIPPELNAFQWKLSEDGYELSCLIEGHGVNTDVSSLLRGVSQHEIGIVDIETVRSSLEDIYVELLERYQ